MALECRRRRWGAKGVTGCRIGESNGRGRERALVEGVRWHWSAGVGTGGWWIKWEGSKGHKVALKGGGLEWEVV